MDGKGRWMRLMILSINTGAGQEIVFLLEDAEGFLSLAILYPRGK